MGLMKELALLPVAPLRFTVWVAEQVTGEVDRSEYSAGAGVQKLEEIEEARAKGEIDEERARELEGQVLEQQLGGSPTAQDEESGEGG